MYLCKKETYGTCSSLYLSRKCQDLFWSIFGSQWCQWANFSRSHQLNLEEGFVEQRRHQFGE